MEKSLTILESLSDRIETKVRQIESVDAHLGDLRSELAYLVKLRVRLAKGEKDNSATEELNTTAEKIADKMPALKAGMVILFDKGGNRILVAPTDYNAESYPLSDYTPEAVLARRANGEWQMVSLVNMCCKHPETGSTDPAKEGCRMPFGGMIDENSKYVGECVSEKHFNEDSCGQVIIDRDGGNCGFAKYGYIASQKFAKGDGDKSTQADKRYYYDDNDHYLPLSTNPDGTPNELFGKGKEAPSFLSDSDNFEKNNAEILKKATRQPEWRIAREIDNNAYLGNYPAAECCARYHTEHIRDWGLPTAPDLVCIMEDWNDIQAGFEAVKKVAPHLAVQLHVNFNYWSSSEYNSGGAYGLDTDYGNMNYYNKNYRYYVRAVCRFRI